MTVPRPTRLKSRTLVMPAPEPGILLQANSYHTTPSGRALLGFYSHLQVSDTVSATWTRRSSDGGLTWSEAESWPTVESCEGVTHRRHYRSGYLDPGTGRFILFRNEARMHQDEVHEWYTLGTLHYAVSTDGGLTFPIDEEISASGGCPGGFRQTMMLGDWSCLPLTLPDGSLLLAPAVTTLDENGKIHNPGGGYTYHDTAVIRGCWRADGGLEWTRLATVSGDPARSYRGMDEATLALIDDGRILMVMRGSNDVGKTVPGYRWFSVSADGGHTWTAPAPWTFEDGSLFFSPGSCSQLLNHSSGAVFWLGNICSENPVVSLPRHPFLLLEVDRASGRLIESSKLVIDDLQPDDAPSIMFSNFSAREDPLCGDIILSMSRMYSRPKPGVTFDLHTWSPQDLDFTSDAFEYRIEVPTPSVS